MSGNLTYLEIKYMYGLVTTLTRLRAGVKEGAGCFHCHGADGAINDLGR